MRSRRVARPLLRAAAAILIAAPLSASQPSASAAGIWTAAGSAGAIDPHTTGIVSSFAQDLEVRRRVLSTGDGAVDATFLVADATAVSTEQLISSTEVALTRLADWLGPLPARAITVVDVPWHAGVAGASFPGVAVTSTRWLSTARDFASERALLAALARQYTFEVARPNGAHAAFAEGLALYLGTRLIHEQLEGRNFATPRFFGGFVPFSLRSVLNSPSPGDARPRLRGVPEVEEPSDAPWRFSASRNAEAQRTARALHTFERYVGWPTLQQVLAAFIDRYRGVGATPADLASVASEIRGRDLSWFFDQAFAPGNRFDYAIETLRSEPADGRLLTTVVVRRTGQGVFAGTSTTRSGDLERARSLMLLVRFEDGSELADWVDGRDIERTFEYRSGARAALASVDPDAMLILDEDRTNNTRTIDAPVNRLGVRLALNWLMWLQDAMMVYTATL